MTNISQSRDDSPLDLGVPTELESYRYRCLVLVGELDDAWAHSRRLKGDTRTLVAMNDALRTELKGLKAGSR